WRWPVEAAHVPQTNKLKPIALGISAAHEFAARFGSRVDRGRIHWNALVDLLKPLPDGTEVNCAGAGKDYPRHLFQPGRLKNIDRAHEIQSNPAVGSALNLLTQKRRQVNDAIAVIVPNGLNYSREIQHISTDHRNLADIHAHSVQQAFIERHIEDNRP